MDTVFGFLGALLYVLGVFTGGLIVIAYFLGDGMKDVRLALKEFSPVLIFFASSVLIPYAFFHDMYVSWKLRKEWELNLPKTFKRHFGYFYFDPQIQKFVDQKMTEVAEKLQSVFQEQNDFLELRRRNLASAFLKAGETLEEKEKRLQIGVGIYKNYFNFLKNLALSFKLEVRDKYSDYLVGNN